MSGRCPVYKSFDYKELKRECPLRLGAYLSDEATDPGSRERDVQSIENYKSYMNEINKNDFLTNIC